MEKKTRHSTRRPRVLGSEIRHRPSEWSVRTVASSGSGRLLGLVGFWVGLDTPNSFHFLDTPLSPTSSYDHHKAPSLSTVSTTSRYSLFLVILSYFFFFFFLKISIYTDSPHLYLQNVFKRIDKENSNLWVGSDQAKKLKLLCLSIIFPIIFI